MAKLELAILVGQESKEWLQKLETLVARLESAGGGGKVKDSDAEEDDEDLTPKKKAAKKVDFDDDEDSDDADSDDNDDSEDEDSEDDDEEEKPKRGRPAKKKALTDDDVNQACKERVARLVEDGTDQKEARAEVVGILKKKFKVKSVAELDPDQYEAVIKVMAK
jgi:hypothetical protein